ncbi:hypothetical protein LSTR_LSTR003134 [Laodelphax striatellus]|uniref:Cuticle protein 6 n=1 Tax=Laodelphax striatellus TaxID=195883 RepID=A0A482WW43_LAOST|nr:hypothetical protein LSTR_LSTR003134 [Laodelphax striatellus]
MPPLYRTLLHIIAAVLLYYTMTVLSVSSAKIGGWDTSPNTQYHIQTDEGPERYFKYQTISGQYRKEKRLQDGTVVGTYGWVDPNGFLRLRDYIADDKGYRIVRTKMVHVGVEAPIGSAVNAAKNVPSQGGVGVENAKIYTRPTAAADLVPSTTPRPIALREYLVQSVTPSPVPSPPPAPISLSNYLKEQQVEVSPNAYTPTTPGPDYIRPQTFRPHYSYKANSIDGADEGRYPYDGIAFTHNGFRYYLPRHYHEEEGLGDKRTGSFGYIDPFGIRRVVYYNTSPNTGFVHRKNNRYVGFNATPYDPRF